MLQHHFAFKFAVGSFSEGGDGTPFWERLEAKFTHEAWYFFVKNREGFLIVPDTPVVAIPFGVGFGIGSSEARGAFPIRYSCRFIEDVST